MKSFSEGKELKASDRAYRTLLEEIQGGILEPGTQLAEVEQAERLGVSRTPMRSAISKLVADGLARQISPRTTVVTGFDEADIRRLFVARRALEETAAKLAAGSSDRDVFAELAREFADAHPEVGDSSNIYYSLIEKFDRALDEAVDNDYIVSALRVIRTHLVRARRLARDNKARLENSAAEHMQIAEAIALGDTELAAHATHVHLNNALNSILDSLTDSNKDSKMEGTK